MFFCWLMHGFVHNRFHSFLSFEILDKKNDNTCEKKYSDYRKIGNHVPDSDYGLFSDSSDDRRLTAESERRIGDSESHREIVRRRVFYLFGDEQGLPFEDLASFYEGSFVGQDIGNDSCSYHVLLYGRDILHLELDDIGIV